MRAKRHLQARSACIWCPSARHPPRTARSCTTRLARSRWDPCSQLFQLSVYSATPLNVCTFVGVRARTVEVDERIQRRYIRPDPLILYEDSIHELFTNSSAFLVLLPCVANSIISSAIYCFSGSGIQTEVVSHNLLGASTDLLWIRIIGQPADTQGSTSDGVRWLPVLQ